MTGGNSHCISEAIDSPLAQPLWQAICLTLGQCKETVKDYDTTNQNSENTKHQQWPILLKKSTPSLAKPSFILHDTPA